MTKLGSEKIPIIGSEAAAKRKQQLEFQVPPHDLCAQLCDNLTENEADQLKLYVDKIRDNCVGQGDIVRYGDPRHLAQTPIAATIVKDKMFSQIGHSDISHNDSLLSSPFKREFNSPLPLMRPVTTRPGYLQQQDTPMRKIKFEPDDYSNIQDIYNISGAPIIPTIEKDRILTAILHSEIVQGILNNPSKVISGSKLSVLTTPLQPNFQESIYLSDENKMKLKNMNAQAIQSGIIHGWAYDKLFQDLNDKNIDFQNDCILEPMSEFRAEYILNEPFRNETSNFVASLGSEILDETPIHFRTLDGIPDFMKTSKSNDSGFDSTPPTPNYNTFPGQLPTDDLIAQPGSFVINDEMNMSPIVRSGVKNNPFTVDSLAQSVGDMQIGSNFVPIKCEKCTIDIVSGEIAVKAKRAGKGVIWHPECFVCFKCNELLADLVYFYHGGHVYCARDLAEILKIPRCNACDELIFTKEYTAAENCTFHIKHFCCFQCDTPLAGLEYVPDTQSNMPLCLSCYDTFHAEKCKHCNIVIGHSEQGVSWGKVHWHGGCFVCRGVNCNKSLLGGKFCVKNDMPFCSPICVKSVIQ